MVTVVMEGNNKLTCARLDKSDKSLGEVPWEAESRDRVIGDGKRGC